jgi:type I restriction enzyme R subunit
MKFNEDSRVKIPAILHLCRLGYEYLALSQVQWEEESNVFPAQFRESLLRINPGATADDVDRAYQDLILNLSNADLGEAFFKQLTDQTGFRLLDLEHFGNNSFHVVTELTYKHGDEEFRPDIICLVNGMPLAFVEVKKPNNRNGLHAEQDRMTKRASLPAFRKFINLTQLMIFSNNMEYDDGTSSMLQGAFYAAPAYGKPVFNYFREEEDTSMLINELANTDDLEDFVLKDNNLQVIKHSEEFRLNKSPDTPTNRILTSLLSRTRLEFLLKYSFAYVRETTGLQKHVMRYPQLFATRAIGRKLGEGIKKGIVWHTQGSGKTALAYYNVKYLTEHFRQQGTIPKFYFIVDRLDLLTQASKEFGARGLVVHHVNSRQDFLQDIKKQTASHNASGKPEITVVNIQKFSDDSTATQTTDYAIDIQRIYFLDEVHRSYNPKGSFLANLERSDPGAIKIGLTGTPLLSSDYDSKDLFGDYFHKYYYNASIADGYTLRLIREEISTRYKMEMEAALKEIELLKGTFTKKEIYAHKKFVAPMLSYITEDFVESRSAAGPLDAEVGAMVVCDSSDQARELYRQFRAMEIAPPTSFAPAAAPDKHSPALVSDVPPLPYAALTPSKAALILHDNGSKQDRKDWVAAFKDGKIDYLFVYNMLLTGFDAKRLKKLYLTRVIRRHNLLQTLTRVNRTYKNARYGYVVDFADISREFEATNRDYFNELQAELGDEMEHYSKLFKTEEEITAEIEEIKNFLWSYDTKNAETFSRQLNEITDLELMRSITKQLTNARELYNLIRLKGQWEMLEKLDFRMIPVLSREANNRLNLLRERDALDNAQDHTSLLNLALEDIVFLFTKVGEEELRLADELKGNLRQTREALADNFDKQDPVYVSLYEELERLFRGKQLDETGQEDMIANNQALVALRDKVRELNRQNRQLKGKYEGDEKAVRVHKRIRERDNISVSDRLLFDSVSNVKAGADDRVLKNQDLLTNEPFFTREMTNFVITEFVKRQKLSLAPTDVKYINQLIVQEYLQEFRGL